MTLTVFRAGNSKVVAIPSAIAEKFGWEIGTKVELKQKGREVILTPAKSPSTLPKDLKSFLESFDKKHSKALKELAER